MRLNLNQLGEAILGEEEAGRRLDAYLELLAREDVEYISVKISSVFSQINLVAFDHTVAHIKMRLRALYYQALRHLYHPPHGTPRPKFINLDMEEYRDLHLTVRAFCEVLDEPEFLNLRAVIVLQAYLPDAFGVQRDLTDWSAARVARGGAPIKFALSKVPTWRMEKVEAALHGWEQAPYHDKRDVDANFKRMVTYGCQPEHAAVVNLGVASHNLFDIAYALLLRQRLGVHEQVEFEMLEDMANHQARAVQAQAQGLLLYAPVVKATDSTARLLIWYVGSRKIRPRKISCTICLDSNLAVRRGKNSANCSYKPSSGRTKRRLRPIGLRIGAMSSPPSISTLGSRTCRIRIFPFLPTSSGSKSSSPNGPWLHRHPSRYKLAVNGSIVKPKVMA